MEKHENPIDALNYHQSVRVYNNSKEIDFEILKRCIQQTTLANNNMQLWKFHYIVSKTPYKRINDCLFVSTCGNYHKTNGCGSD